MVIDNFMAYDRRRPPVPAPEPVDGRPAPEDVIVRAPGADQGIRWRPGERLDLLFESRCDRLRAHGEGGRLAVDSGELTLTYDELDAWANQLARHLVARRLRSGDRVGLLLDRAVESYAAMLAVLKARAAYVPLDVGFPPDRIAYIVGDAGVRLLLSRTTLIPQLANVAGDVEVLHLDAEGVAVAARSGDRLTEDERDPATDELAYIIYTSGTTGRPKGVAIDHASICNFVRVAAEVYGIRARDRVYQGMTIAFDFSVEEIWVPWMAGATLVPKPAGSSLVGVELHAFLTERRVTAMCCVPTLLATIEEDLPELRFLLVSGEACPQDLIARWHKAGRRFLNVYGPTEATVTATWTAVRPDRPVTIGVPLPTYSAVILGRDDPGIALPPGEVGEIGIAGIGLATGYLNREDLTEKAFIPDFLGIAGNPSGRIYRTGDLGRVNEAGEIEYHGRIDLQVKIRGYRIELTEIESVLLQVPGIAAAAVGTFEPTPGTVELVGYYSLRSGVETLDIEAISAQLRERLPAYMVPAYLEHLDVIPMTTSDKADREALPAPTRRRGLVGEGEHVVPESRIERRLVEALAAVLGAEQVSVTADFFDDLGANSLVMARFCAQARRAAELPVVGMRDVYSHRNIRELATALQGTGVPAARLDGAPPVAVPRRVGTAGYLLTGVAQLLFLAGLSYLTAAVSVLGFEWVGAAVGLVAVYLRTAAFVGGTFVGACLLPIAAKWVLIGRWRPLELRVWSPPYLRFWLVRTLLRLNPMVLFAGSPLYVVYLRLLGARIGRGVTVLSTALPVCADLITIGPGSVIRKDCAYSGYRVDNGVVRTGRVTLGADVFVGEMTVIDIDTAMGDGAQLGHASSLHTGQRIPAGESWHGSPAEPAGTRHRRVPPARCGSLRRALYGIAQVVVRVGIVLPVSLLVVIPLLGALLPGRSKWLVDRVSLSPAGWVFWIEELAISAVLFFGAVLLGLLLVFTVPRVLARAVRPDRVYRLYGWRFTVHRTIARLTNFRFYNQLFGDSSAIVHYLRPLGYDLSRVQQTGSNFGLAVKHETPYQVTFGRGTMVSDGLSIANAEYSSTSFRITRARIGPRSFLGNNIVYPAGGRTGPNVLLGTKVMIPLDGPVRENTGLLGSPPMEIPRTVQRDREFAVRDPARLRELLWAKNRHNAATIGMFLLARWLQFFGVTVIAVLGQGLYRVYGTPAVAASILGSLGFTVAFLALVERAAIGFRSLQPRFCSIYDRAFWRHERYWKLSNAPMMTMFNGTPIKSVMWRLLGVRVGRRLYDDGCGIPEKSLVTIGDDCTLGSLSVIQCHSLEDGTFKSDRVVIGDGATLCSMAFVHYGVTTGEGATIEPDAFLMKGEQIGPRERWAGNPARPVRATAPAGTALAR